MEQRLSVQPQDEGQKVNQTGFRQKAGDPLGV